MTEEEICNIDLIDILKEELATEFPNINIIKGKVLKDIFLNKNPKSQKYKIQFGFVDQDIVFYEEEMDISSLHSVENILIHNNSGNSDRLIVPKLICELKYNGINSHGLITYSDYASDIKSIFPECKYWLWKSQLGLQLAYNIYFGLGLLTFTWIEKVCNSLKRM